jgi:hypothetical protein
VRVRVSLGGHGVGGGGGTTEGQTSFPAATPTTVWRVAGQTRIRSQKRSGISYRGETGSGQSLCLPGDLLAHGWVVSPADLTTNCGVGQEKREGRFSAV